jgi:hypothetical protein
MRRVHMQIDRNGQRATAEVMRYDAHKVRHEVRWTSQTRAPKRTSNGTLLNSATAWVDFAEDIVYQEVL